MKTGSKAKILNLLPRFKKTVLDILFPVSCFSCGAPDQWLCGKCFSRIPIFEDQVCPICEQVRIPSGNLCFYCKKRKKPHLDSLIVAVSYRNPLVRLLVSGFKYRFIADLAEPLGNLITGSAMKNDLPVPDFIVPVPLHPRRLRWRGFNQSRLLAEKIHSDIAPPLKIEVLEIIERKKLNRPQMGIKKYSSRLKNVEGIFSMKEEYPNLSNKKILLVDDVATTGATLEECAKVLKQNGAKKVFGMVIARQSVKK